MIDSTTSDRRDSSPLAVLQWNCRSVLSKSDVTPSLFEKYDVLALSETWLTVDTRFNLHNFVVFRRDSDSRFGGGLALAVRPSLSYSYIDNSITFAGRLITQAISIHFTNYDLTIISIYRYPGGSLSLEEYDALFSYCRSFPNAILLGDFNAHHTEWGCERTDGEGVLLFSSSEASFTCINDGSPTFLTRPGQRPSAIDLAFISSSIIGLCKWAILEDTYLSDLHFPTSILFNRSPIRRKFFSHRVKHSKSLDERFAENLNSLLDSLREILRDFNLSTDQRYFHFADHLLRQWPPCPEKSRSSEGCSSQRRGGGKRFSPPAPWWNEECQQAVASRRALLSTFKKYPTFSNYLIFKKQEAITWRILRAEKRKGWKEFCNRLNPNTLLTISYLWRFIKRFRTRKFEVPTSPLSSSLVPSFPVQNTIDSLCPPSVFNRVFSSIDNFPTNYSCKIFDDPFTIQELTSAIRNLKIHTSPGFDKIGDRMLSLLPEEYLSILLDIYNSIFDSGSFPDTWRHSLVFLIPKSSLDKLRPISLTSCLLKVFERIILYRLEWWVESSLILSPFNLDFVRELRALIIWAY